MPKQSTFPILFDDVLQLDISKLKGWGYFQPNQIRSGTLTWSRGGQTTGAISITVNTNTMEIELDYKFRNESIKYIVEICSVTSNLGKGDIHYFLCPKTYKPCRKLYSIGGYFYHRSAFNDCMYESQTQSKKIRPLNSTLNAYFKCDEYYSELNKKHFKKYYAGKPTKRYLKLLKQIEIGERLDSRDIEMLMMM